MNSEPKLITILKIVMSWKTTIFGLMAAIGGSVVAGLSTGLIDASELPKWIKGVAGLMAVIGTAGLGFFARDNSTSDEEAGAKQASNNGSGTKSGTSLLLVIAALWGIAGAGLIGAGCSGSLAPGGAYAPLLTNSVTGATTPAAAPDYQFFLYDSAYQTAWNGINAAFDFEANNRAWLWKLDPNIKKTLDGIRPQAVSANADYLTARGGYLANPTPAGLGTVGTLLGRLQQFSTAAGAVLPKALAPPAASVTTTNK